MGDGGEKSGVVGKVGGQGGGREREGKEVDHSRWAGWVGWAEWAGWTEWVAAAGKSDARLVGGGRRQRTDPWIYTSRSVLILDYKVFFKIT